MAWLDKIDLMTLGIVALLLGLAPFSPEPHLLEKGRMLLEGTLSRPIDIFDLFLHATPGVLFVIKILRIAARRGD